MIKFLTKHSSKLFVLGAMASLAALAFSSCTDVDNTLGEDLLDKRPVKIDDSFILNAYTTNGTQFPTNLSLTGWLGSYQDPVFGETDASLAIPFYPSNISTYKALYDSLMHSRLRIDNITLYLKLNRGVGDSLDYQTLSVYKMTDTIGVSTKYYSDSPLKRKIEDNVIKTLNYNRIKNDSVKIPLGIDFAKKVFSPTDTSKITNIIEFHKQIYGLYLKSSRIAGKGGLHEIDFTNSALTLSYLVKSKISGKDSTVYFNFKINSTTQQYGTVIPEVGFVSHSYNGSDPLSPKRIVDPKVADLGTPDQLTYVQGLGGLRTLLKFDAESVKKWEGKNRNIHRAELIVSVPEDVKIDYYRLPLALSGYSMNVKDTTFIVDMYAFVGNQTNAYYNRSKRQYSINITTYFKNLMRDPSRPRELYLYAGFPRGLTSSSNVAFTTLTADYLGFPSQLVLGNKNSSNPFKLLITYSENE